MTAKKEKKAHFILISGLRGCDKLYLHSFKPVAHPLNFLINIYQNHSFSHIENFNKHDEIKNDLVLIIIQIKRKIDEA